MIFPSFDWKDLIASKWKFSRASEKGKRLIEVDVVGRLPQVACVGIALRHRKRILDEKARDVAHLVKERVLKNRRRGKEHKAPDGPAKRAVFAGLRRALCGLGV